MLLVIDVGNTHFVVGMYDHGELTAPPLRIHTDRQRTSDEYGILFRAILREQGCKLEDVHGVAIASVVPGLRPQLEDLCSRYLKAPYLFVSASLNLGLTIKTDNPAELGTDMMVGAVGARARHPGALIVADFGTATKIYCVSTAGEFLGTAIAPGFMIAADSLYQRAPHLPRIRFEAPPSPIGTNTIHSMQSGIVLGHAGMVDALVARMKDVLAADARVVATGGLAEVVAPHCRTVQAIEPHLVLEGIRILWERNPHS
ncbi:MAG: type III pantothenate kinase [Candidatus Xenobia bacterium]